MLNKFNIVLLIALLAACQGKATTPGEGSGATETPNGATGTNGATAPDEIELPPFAPPAPKMRRLSRVEYENTIHDLFGEFVNVPDLEPDTPVNGFTSIGNAQIATSRLGVEKYETAALSIAHQVLANPARTNLIDCTPNDFIDGPCATEFIENVGPRVFRRPLTAVEIQKFSTVAQLGMRDLKDFWQGLEFGLAALLQSPNFLYRTEWGEVGSEDRRRLTAYEVASRLSYLLWASTPDDALLAAAAEGKLDTADGIYIQVERMLSNPRSQRGLRTLWDEFLQMDALAEEVKDPTLYPEFGPELAASMREETLRLIEHYMNSDRDFREIYSTRTTFIDDRLAALYGLTFNATPGEFIEVELPADSPRRGILSHASFLAGQSHAALNSPTLRGLFVRQSLLCLPIPPPPPNVSTTLPEYETEGATLRDKLTVHMESDACAGCHQLMDPIGFGFEHFDAIGRYRELDNGNAIDASGDLDGKTFAGAAELGNLVATHPSATTCMVRKLYRHATGHVEDENEEILIRDLATDWEAGGFRFRDLLLSLVTSEGFLYVEGE